MWGQIWSNMVKYGQIHGSLNVPIEHHPTIGYMVYNGYHKVMSNIPKMGQLPTPEIWSNFWQILTNSPCFGPRKTRRAVAAESAAVRSSNSCKSQASVASKIGSRNGDLPTKPTLWIAGYEIFHGRLQKNQLYSTTDQGLQRINDYVNEENNE